MVRIGFVNTDFNSWSALELAGSRIQLVDVIGVLVISTISFPLRDTSSLVEGSICFDSALLIIVALLGEVYQVRQTFIK